MLEQLNSDDDEDDDDDDGVLSSAVEDTVRELEQIDSSLSLITILLISCSHFQMFAYHLCF